MSKKRTDSSNVFHSVEKYEKVKNELIKSKQNCSSSFVKVFKFQENKFKIVQKNFLEIRLLVKPTIRDDHYMINMVSQRLKIGSN